MKSFDLRNSFNIYSMNLDNGLKVALIPITKSPVICVNIAYKVGSKDERFDRTGMAHLFEHLMFEGTKKAPNGEFDRLCSLAGGSNNAYTSFDITNYYMSLPSNQLDLGLWLEADRMQNFRITNEALKNQQDVVIEEINQTVDDQPYGLWRGLMSAAAYSENSSYSWEVHGKKDHVAAVNLDDAETFRKMFYQPANACLTIVGDIQVDDAFDKITKYFGGINKFNGKIQRNLFDNTHLMQNTLNSFSENVPLPAVFIAYHAKGFIDDSIYTNDIIADILGNGRSSRLNSKLVYEEQIASQAGAFVDKREHDSLITLYAFANSPDISCDLLYEKLDLTIQEFISREVDDNEIIKSQNQLSTKLAFEIQSLTGLANELAQFALFYNDPEKIYEILNYYNKVSKTDLLNSAHNIFNDQKPIRIDAII